MLLIIVYLLQSSQNCLLLSAVHTLSITTSIYRMFIDFCNGISVNSSCLYCTLIMHNTTIGISWTCLLFLATPTLIFSCSNDTNWAYPSSLRNCPYPILRCMKPFDRTCIIITSNQCSTFRLLAETLIPSIFFGNAACLC